MESDFVKDRHAMLSPVLLDLLRDWWRIARPTAWLFTGQDPLQPISTRQLNRACHAAAVMAEIRKRVTPHTLRHNAESRIMPSNLAIPPRSAQTKASVRSTGA
jgi:integrase/recombinase XerD